VCVLNVPFNGFRAFVIHHVKSQLVVSSAEGGKNVSEGRDERCISAGWHRTNNDGGAVVNAGNEDVLHIFERSDGEVTCEVHEHGSSVGIGERGKAKHVLHGTRFVRREHTIKFHVGKTYAVMSIVCGSSICPMVSHVALVGCRGAWKMGAN
jgi:hypothetical protein